MKLMSMTKKSHPLNYNVVHYNLKWIAWIHELVVNNSFTYKELMAWIFRATPNAPKLCMMQKLSNLNAQRV